MRASMQLRERARMQASGRAKIGEETGRWTVGPRARLLAASLSQRSVGHNGVLRDFLRCAHRMCLECSRSTLGSTSRSPRTGFAHALARASQASARLFARAFARLAPLAYTCDILRLECTGGRPRSCANYKRACFVTRACLLAGMCACGHSVVQTRQHANAQTHMRASVHLDGGLFMSCCSS